jgi:hypothetical protein
VKDSSLNFNIYNIVGQKRDEIFGIEEVMLTSGIGADIFISAFGFKNVYLRRTLM